MAAATPLKRFDFNLFTSYNHSSKVFVDKLEAAVKTRPDLKMWRDLNEVRGDLFGSISKGMASSEAVVCIMSEGYVDSLNCDRELSLALAWRKPVLLIRMAHLPDPLLPEHGTYAAKMALLTSSMLCAFLLYALI